MPKRGERGLHCMEVFPIRGIEPSNGSWERRCSHALQEAKGYVMQAQVPTVKKKSDTILGRKAS